MRIILTMHAWAFRFMGNDEGLRNVLRQNWRDGWQTAWRYYYEERDFD